MESAAEEEADPLRDIDSGPMLPGQYVEYGLLQIILFITSSHASSGTNLTITVSLTHSLVSGISVCDRN